MDEAHLGLLFLDIIGSNWFFLFREQQQVGGQSKSKHISGWLTVDPDSRKGVSGGGTGKWRHTKKKKKKKQGKKLS